MTKYVSRKVTEVGKLINLKNHPKYNATIVSLSTQRILAIIVNDILWKEAVEEKCLTNLKRNYIP